LMNILFFILFFSSNSPLEFGIFSFTSMYILSLQYTLLTLHKTRDGFLFEKS
jgi:hypothetical protein